VPIASALSEQLTLHQTCSRREPAGNGAGVEEGAENWQVEQISVWSPAVDILRLPKPTCRSAVPVTDRRAQASQVFTAEKE
jgi:hypothetical protein